MIPEKKTCSKCKKKKLVSNFPKDTTKKDGYHSSCKKCLSSRRKGNTTAINRKCKYGLTQEQFDLRFAAQYKCCAACGTTETHRWCIDHDHKCCPKAVTCGNCVRGILCYSCNIILGHCNEDKDALLNLVHYLEEYGS